MFFYSLDKLVELLPPFASACIGINGLWLHYHHFEDASQSAEELQSLICCCPLAAAAAFHFRSPEHGCCGSNSSSSMMPSSSITNCCWKRIMISILSAIVQVSVCQVFQNVESLCKVWVVSDGFLVRSQCSWIITSDYISRTFTLFNFVIIDSHCHSPKLNNCSYVVQSVVTTIFLCHNCLSSKQVSAHQVFFKMQGTAYK